MIQSFLRGDKDVLLGAVLLKNETRKTKESQGEQ